MYVSSCISLVCDDTVSFLYLIPLTMYDKQSRDTFAVGKLDSMFIFVFSSNGQKRVFLCVCSSMLTFFDTLYPVVTRNTLRRMYSRIWNDLCLSNCCMQSLLSDGDWDSSSEASSIICPWSEIMAMIKEEELMQDSDDDKTAESGQEYEESEWLPGELEYYQNMCDEIYPPAHSPSTRQPQIDGDSTQERQEPQEDTDRIISDTEGETTSDSGLEDR